MSFFKPVFMPLFTIVVLFTSIIFIPQRADSQAVASNSLITTPVAGPPNSSILGTATSTFKITAKDSLNSNAGNAEYFWVDLYSSDSCEVGYGSISCDVLCFPYTSPHTPADQCLSGINNQRATKTSSTALWTIANIGAGVASVYDVTYYESIEVSGFYTVSAYLLTIGGLYAQYWDNIWFSGSPSKTETVAEINFQWGTEAITNYGTDYISARFEGKIKPPYTETFKFYLYADDGARLWIDKNLIINAYDQCCNESWGSVALNSLIFHDIIVEYREIGNDAYIELRWSSDSIAKEIVPAMYFYSQEHIKNSPYTNVYIEPGVVSFEQTIVNDVAPFTAASNIAGVNTSVEITATDAFGHLLGSDTAVWNLTDLDPSAFNSTFIWRDNGIYRITFMSTAKTAGTDFHIRLGVHGILDSPFTVVIAPAETSPPNTTLAGSGLSAAIAGYSAFFDITVYDIFGNERETSGDSILIRFYGAGAGHATCAYTSAGYGNYSCTYTLTIAGTYTPEITINDELLLYSSSIAVTAGDIHGPSCTIESKNININAGEYQSVVIQSRDQFTNPITTATADNYVITIVSTSDPSNVYVSNVNLASMGAGLYNITFQPTISDTYVVRIQLDDLHQIAGGTTYELVVNPNVITPGSTFVDRGTGHLSAESDVETYFIVQLADAYNNYLLSEETANVSPFTTTDLVCGAVTTTAVCAYVALGEYRCTYTPTVSGSCTLSVQISASNIHDSPFSLSVAPGVIDADLCYVTSVEAVGTAGDDQYFVIHSSDMNANNITDGGHTYNMYLVDTDGVHNAVEGGITDNMDGTYTVVYSTTIADTYESLNIQLTQSGGLFSQYYTDYSFTNLFASGAIDAVISFDWGTSAPAIAAFPASDYFSARWTGKLVPPYSETYTIFTNIYGGSGVRLYINAALVIDQFDPLDGETEPFVRIQLTAHVLYDLQLDFREQTGNAKVSLEWQSASFQTKTPIASQYLYYVKDIGGSQFIANLSIIPANTFASNIEIAGAALISAVAGDSNDLAIIAKDIYGNVQTAASDESANFAIYLIGDTDTVQTNGVIVADNGGADGAYTATYNITDATQTYTLYVTYDSANIANSPFAIKLYAGDIHVNNSYAVLSNGRTGELQTFDFHLKDIYGNVIDSVNIPGTTSIAFLLTHENTVTTVTSLSITDNANGVYTITFNATKSGTYTADITVNSTYVITNIQPPNGINMSNAIASSSKSYVKGWVNGASTTINAGTDTIKVIQAMDIYSNVISDQGGYNFYATLHLSSNASANTDHAHIIAGTNGTYNVHVNATAIGVYTLNVMLASGDYQTPDGLYGEYFNNRWLSGTPILEQIDPNINLNWNTSLVTTTAKDYVSVRWTGYIKPTYAELYTFTVESDDGSRLYIDDTLVFDNFLSNAGSFSGTFAFWRASLLYRIRIEYRENTAEANITMSWVSSSQTTEIVPQSVLFATANHIKSSPFTVTAV